MAYFRPSRNIPLRPLAIVVDDEPLVRASVAAQLRIWEYDVIQFATADVALAFIHADPEAVAFVYTDVRMPGSLDGAELARILARTYPTLPVLVSSGHVQFKTGELPETCAFLPKPWLPGEFLKYATHLAAQQASVVASAQVPMVASLTLH
jgi:FixJ family two-component response regulator